MAAPDAGVMRDPKLRRVAMSSFVGTAIEWYDFFLYGTATALVFSPRFFPSHSQTASTLASFATFAVGFAARPVGAVIFGHLGDRLGRKSTLVTSMMVMGLSTFCIGLLPTYDAIGLWAPALLVVIRLVQGIGVGGEWGGATLVAMENAPAGKRGRFSSFPQLGSPIGTIAATGSFWLVSMLPDPAFLSWGWRLPFLASIVLIIVGLVIRSRVEETEEFRRNAAEKRLARLPVVTLLRTQSRQVLLAAGMRFSDNSLYYLATVFAIDYATKRLGLDRTGLLNAVLIASVIAFPFILATGRAAERFGLMRMFLLFAGAGVIFAFVFFGMLDLRSGLFAGAAITIMILISDGMYAVEPALFSGLFPAEVRYSGVSLGFHLSSVVAGGLSPLIATALFAWAGNWWPVAVYIAFMGIVSFTCGTLAARWAGQDAVRPAAVAS